MPFFTPVLITKINIGIIIKINNKIISNIICISIRYLQ